MLNTRIYRFNLFCFVLLIHVFAGSHAQTQRISAQRFTTPQYFSNLDSLIITKCGFEQITGDALRFENIAYVLIEGCEFVDINNTVGTRAAVCGRSCGSVRIRASRFDNILGTAIRFPIDGSSLAAQRTGTLSIDSVEITRTRSNATQEGTGIRVFHCDSVKILNSRIQRTDYHGLFLGRNSTAATQNDQKIIYCQVENNRIDSTLGDGIMAQENILSSVVRNNIISNVAWDGVGAKPTEGDHGMYWQASAALIEGNTVYNVYDGLVSGNPGSGISLRTNATVNRNLIHDCTGNGIGYFNDHPGKDLLLITNNVVYNNSRNGIYINGSNGNILDPQKVRHPDRVAIYHNTVINDPVQAILHHSSPVALYLMQSSNEMAGNLLVFEGIEDTSQFLRILSSRGTDTRAWNYYSSGDPGFNDKPGHDYTLAEGSAAIDFLPSNTSYVQFDFEQHPRSGRHDAGAYEFGKPLHNPVSERDDLIQVFPNPFHDRFQISGVKDQITCTLYNLQGKILYSGDLSFLSSLPLLSSGMYLLYLHSDPNQVIRLFKK